jgi:hypothetical protein
VYIHKQEEKKMNNLRCTRRGRVKKLQIGHKEKENLSEFRNRISGLNISDRTQLIEKLKCTIVTLTSKRRQAPIG